jgi:hypothetical protein
VAGLELFLVSTAPEWVNFLSADTEIAQREPATKNDKFLASAPCSAFSIYYEEIAKTFPETEAG